jgi:hypothetical protein
LGFVDHGRKDGFVPARKAYKVSLSEKPPGHGIPDSGSGSGHEGMRAGRLLGMGHGVCFSWSLDFSQSVSQESGVRLERGDPWSAAIFSMKRKRFLNFLLA